MTKIISFSGISNSGKTTIIEGLCKILIPDFKVAVVKHDPKNKVEFDTIGKDSYKFFASGADVAVVSPSQSTIRFQRQIYVTDVLNLLGYRQKLDYVFIEGFKTMPFKRICVVRENFEQEDIEHSQAIATTKSNFRQFKKLKDKDVLDINNHHDILRWIDTRSW